MLSFFTGPITGVSLGINKIQVAHAQQKNGSLLLLKHGEQDVPTSPPVATSSPEPTSTEASAKVTPEETATKKPDDVSTILQSLKSTSSLSLKRSVVLLHPELVYTQVFTFPTSSKSNLQASINDVVTRTIPEEFTELLLRTKILVQSKEQVVVGVAAVRKDVLQTNRDMLTKAKMTVLSYSTAPCAVIAADQSEKPVSFLLATAWLGQTIVTLFHHEWPIDEAILPAGSNDIEAIVKIGMSIANEYSEQGITVDTMLLAGPWESANLPSAPSLTMKTVFPNFAEKPWLATACASVVKTSDLSVNFGG